KFRRILEGQLIVKREGQRIYVNRSWYGLTVDQKQGAVFMMAVVYNMDVIHVFDGYSANRLGLFDKNHGGWHQREEEGLRAELKTFRSYVTTTGWGYPPLTYSGEIAYNAEAGPPGFSTATVSPAILFCGARGDRSQNSRGPAPAMMPR